MLIKNFKKAGGYINTKVDYKIRNICGDKKEH